MDRDIADSPAGDVEARKGLIGVDFSSGQGVEACIRMESRKTAISLLDFLEPWIVYAPNSGLPLRG
jgi:hypothetical protein